MELQLIQNKIYEIRGFRVMLDFDLAEMYEVETRRLKEQVRRNTERFPNDFMFQLTKTEWNELVAICDKLPENIKHTPAMPFAFTEQGVAMLSSVLRSSTAIQINIGIMRAFVAIRNAIYSISPKNIEERIKALEEANEELLKDINDLSEDTRHNFEDIYMALSEMSERKKLEDRPRNPIGFKK